MEQEIRTAARRVIAEMARVAENDEPVPTVHYQSMLAQLALAQVALAYPRASLGTCVEHDAPLYFDVQGDSLYVRCSQSDCGHLWKIC